VALDFATLEMLEQHKSIIKSQISDEIVKKKA
jgi:hypothetical protein